MTTKKKSTQEQKIENFNKFMSWKDSMSDEDYKQIVSTKGTLARQEIITQCQFGRSSINSNLKIQKELKKLEDTLRKDGILPPKVAKSTKDQVTVRDKQSSKNVMGSKKLSRLEQEVTALRAENQKLKNTLIKYKHLDEALNESGRPPII